MTEPIGQDIPIEFTFTVGGAPAVGFSPAPTVDVFAPNGTQIVTDAAMTVRATALQYRYTLTGLLTTANGAGNYTVRAYTSDIGADSLYMEYIAQVVSYDLGAIAGAITTLNTNVAAIATDVSALETNVAAITTDISAIESTLTVIQSETSLISAGSVTVISPVDVLTNDLTVVRGDDYTTSTGRTLPTWSSADFPVLTGATVYFRAQLTDQSDTPFETTCDVLSATGTKSVRVQLTPTQTSAFNIGERLYDYEIRAEFDSGTKPVRLVRGKMTVNRDIEVE